MQPKVSIVIPAYNRAHLLSRALNSVLLQTYQDFEIIVVDDCSTDNIQELMKNFGDPRIRYIRHERNKGGSAARNTGIREAKGELIAFLDSDDEWLPTKLEKQLRLFDQSNVGLVYCGFIYIEAGTGEGERWLVKCDKDFRDELLISNFIGTTSGAIVRKELLNQINGFDEALRSCQDWDLYIRLSEICGLGCVPECLVLYHIDRKCKNQITTNPKSTISGHSMIQEKYSDKINMLNNEKKLRHIDYLLNVYSRAVSSKVIPLAFTGFKLSYHPKYLFWTMKIVIKICLKNINRKDSLL